MLTDHFDEVPNAFDSSDQRSPGEADDDAYDGGDDEESRGAARLHDTAHPGPQLLEHDWIDVSQEAPFLFRAGGLGQMSSMIAISAPSPRRGPTLTIRV